MYPYWPEIKEQISPIVDYSKKKRIPPGHNFLSRLIESGVILRHSQECLLHNIRHNDNKGARVDWSIKWCCRLFLRRSSYKHWMAPKRQTLICHAKGEEGKDQGYYNALLVQLNDWYHRHLKKKTYFVLNN